MVGLSQPCFKLKLDFIKELQSDFDEGKVVDLSSFKGLSLAQVAQGTKNCVTTICDKVIVRISD
jgi:hypothetical protein